jgi:hypothetical protein
VHSAAGGLHTLVGWSRCAAELHTLIWNNLRQRVFCSFSDSTSLDHQEISVQAASTMNHSDIRGLSRLAGTEPTLIFFVDSCAFYYRESGKQTRQST